MSIWTYMNIKGQGHSLTLVQGHPDPILWIGWTKAFQKVQITWPRWSPCPYMVKKTLKIFAWTERPMTLKLGMQHRVLEYYQVCSSDAPGLTLTFFTQRQIWSPMFLYGEKIKTMDFSATIVVYDIKVGRCSKLGEYMKLYEYQRSRSFIDLGPNHSDSIFLNFFSSITADFNIS